MAKSGSASTKWRESSRWALGQSRWSSASRAARRAGAGVSKPASRRRFQAGAASSRNRSAVVRAADRLRQPISCRSIRVRRASFDEAVDRVIGAWLVREGLPAILQRASISSSGCRPSRERRDRLDPDGPSQDARGLRVDRREPGIDLGILVPRTNESIGLDGLPTRILREGATIATLRLLIR